MKALIVSPLALFGAKHGYNRPLDRADFEGGSVPGWAGAYMPGVGETRRFANLTGMTGSSAVPVDMYGFDSTAKLPLGTIAVTRDGRVFRYARAGASDLVAGNLIQSAAPVANHLALTSAAQAIGDGGTFLRPIVVTPGATSGAAQLYAEGQLVVDTTPGNGYAYRIASHGAITASTAFNLLLDPDDLLQVAFTTATRYGLHTNPYQNVIQTPTTITACVAGVAVVPITATYYGWIQTRGPAAVLINGTPAVTAPVINGATTAGSVDVWTAAAQPTASMVGRMMQVGVSGKNNRVFLTID